MSVLIVGAAGYFGRRLVKELAPAVDVVLGGRRRAPLDTLAAEIGGGTVRVVDLADADTVGLALDGVACAVCATVAAGSSTYRPTTIFRSARERSNRHAGVPPEATMACR